MPVVDIVVALIVVRRSAVADQYLHPHGVRHQDHTQCRGSGGSRRLGPAGVPNVGAGKQLQIPAVSGCYREHALLNCAGEVCL